MEEKQKINAKIKNESVGEEHDRIISIKEDQRLQKRESIDYSYISKNKRWNTVGEEHDRIISIQENQRLRKRKSIDYSCVNKNKR